MGLVPYSVSDWHSWAAMREELGDTEERILKELFRQRPRALGHRELMYSGISDKPLRRGLERLKEEGYISVRSGWKHGMKKPYYLKPKGKRAASRLTLGDTGRKLFFDIFERLESIVELHNDKGERVIEYALEIVNLLEGEEASTRFQQAIFDLFGRKIPRST